MTTNTAHSAIEIALGQKGTAPHWIQLFPADGVVRGRDGRSWVNDPDAVIAAFEADAHPLPLDYEHASQHKAPHGDAAPAAGWIEKLENRGGAVWAQIDWTERGRGSVASREYRFVSPGFTFDKVTKKVQRIVHAGLTNQPNFKMAALSQVQTAENEDTPMSTKPITDALDLVDGASTDKIVAAIAALKDQKEVALASAAKPDPEKYVAKPLLDAALAQVKTFEDAAKEGREAEIVKTVDELIAAGDPNHPPANRDKYLELCRMDGGFDLFKQLYAPSADVALNQTKTADSPAPASGASKLTVEELAVCHALGVSEEDFLKGKTDDAAA